MLDSAGIRNVFR